MKLQSYVKLDSIQIYHLLGGLVVRICGSHPHGLGSIPGLGTFCIVGSVVESSPATLDLDLIPAQCNITVYFVSYNVW